MADKPRMGDFLDDQDAKDAAFSVFVAFILVVSLTAAVLILGGCDLLSKTRVKGEVEHKRHKLTYEKRPEASTAPVRSRSY